MIACLALPLALAAAPNPAQEARTMPLIDFRAEAAASAWRPVHDGVMGGVSSGRSTPTPDGVRFEGTVSLENNGGFASFRLGTRLPDLSGHDGLRLRVRGDGLVYKLSLRTDGGWDGISWQAPFLAREGDWTEVELTFEDLTPTWRGRLVRDAGPFDASSIRQIGIVIADKQDGPFAMDLAAIDASGSGTEGVAARRAHTDALAKALDAGVDAEELADTLRWQERVLVVAAPYDLDALASRQIGHFLAESSQLAERELRVVHLMGPAHGRLAGRTLSSGQVRALREHWELPTDAWTVALVGKDGAVKGRWPSLVTPEEVFERIDAMPMRQAEVEVGTAGDVRSAGPDPLD